MTNPTLLADALARLADTLLASSAAGTLVLALVWLVCRAFPRLPAGIKATLWWLACARLLVGLVWVTPVALPILPAGASIGAASTGSADVADTRSATDFARGIQNWPSTPTLEFLREADASLHPRSPVPSPMGTRAADRRGDETRVPGLLTTIGSRPWRALFAGAWILAAAGFFTRALRAFGRHRGLVARAQPLDARELHDIVGIAAAPRWWPSRGPRMPAIRSSREITSPQLVWIGHPVVLVPATLAARGDNALAWAICHEVVHLRRRDHWSGLVVHAAERLFFFHPLVHVAAREFLVCREIACDAEVVRLTSAPPRDYGRLLVSLGIRGDRSRLAVAGAANSLRALKRRLIMLQHVPSSPVSRWWRLVAVVAIAGVIPIQLVARRPPQGPPPAQVGAPGHGASAGGGTTVTGQGISGGVAGGIGQGVSGGVAGGASGGFYGGVPDLPDPPDQVPPPPPPPPPPPAPPAPPAPPLDADGFALVSSENGESWAYVSGNTNVMIHGAPARSARIDALRRAGTPFFWFERDGREYVIRDAATLRRIEALLEPMHEVSDREEQLAATQADLGARQGALGARQAEVAAKQAEMAAQQAALAAEQLNRQASREATARAAADLERQARQLEAQMAQLERELEPLSEQQEELGRHQGRLGAEQEALARAQAHASRRSQERLRTILDQSIADGTATTVR